jgi:hypothetical protein
VDDGLDGVVARGRQDGLAAGMHAARAEGFALGTHSGHALGSTIGACISAILGSSHPVDHRLLGDLLEFPLENGEDSRLGPDNGGVEMGLRRLEARTKEAVGGRLIGRSDGKLSF